MRPGNAGANNAADHIEVQGDAIGQLPDACAAGHDLGDHPDLVEHALLVRADAVGASHWLAEEIRLRSAEFSIGYAIDQRFRDGTCCIQDEDWVPAIDTNGEPRPGAEVVELTAFVNLNGRPEATRLIVRRERPHPGAQLTLFDTIEGRRHIAFITDNHQRRHRRPRTTATTTSPRREHHRRHQGMRAREPAVRLHRQQRHLDAALLRRQQHARLAQRIGCIGPLAKATPTTIRQRLLSIAGAITPTGRRLHLDTRSPWTTQLLNAITRVRTAFTSLTVTTTAPPQQPL